MSSSGDVAPPAESPRPRSGRTRFLVPRRVAEVEGRDLALQLALTHGLGLVGAGAPAAARAFLAETLSEQPPGKIVIVIPALDLTDLLGLPSPAALPQLPIGLQATTSLDGALDLLETQTMIRALHLPEPQRHEQWKPIYLLMAMTSRCDPDRLQVVLKLGEGYGVAGVLLGYWWPGVTVSAQEDGTVIPASPGLSRLMRDVPIGSLDVARTIRRLEVLVRHRQPSEPPD